MTISGTNENDENGSIEDEDSTCFTDIGFMFDNAQDTKKECLTFIPLGYQSCEEDVKNDSEHAYRTVQVKIQFIDENPGAVQSGHYLWPAASALAQYLVTNFHSDSSLNTIACQYFSNEMKQSITSIVELGAGCGLLSLVAAQIFPNLICSVVTDHDPGTLERAEGNYFDTRENLMQNYNEKFQDGLLFHFECLEWGDKHEALSLKSRFNNDANFDLIVGSDLIYCREVVFPLLDTASQLLTKTKHEQAHMEPFFILSQSFPFDDETEQEIDESCKKLGLCRTVLISELDKNSSKIQLFTL